MVGSPAALETLDARAALVAHMRGLMRTSPGFNPDQLLTFRLTMAETIASDQAARVAYQKRLIDELESVPGVAAAAFANQLPLDGCCMGGAIYPEARATDPDAVERTSFVFATPGFFRTMQAPLEHGRLLDERDATADPVHVVINHVIEALNASEEEFGEERLKDLLRRLVDLPVQQISSAIAAGLKNWIRDAPQYDDLTFIMLKVNQA